MNKKNKILVILGIIFISFNLRAPITAVGSVVDMISAEYGLSSTMAGFITTLPLVAFAIVSPFVSKVSIKFGNGKVMFLGLLFMLMGELVRSYTNVYGLYIGTALLGIGIAIGNVLMPSMIKGNFTKGVGAMTSVYTSAMCIFAAVGAGISVPLAKGLELGWKNSLASWFILTLLTIVIWMPQLKNNGQKAAVKKVEKSEKATSIWKSKTAWWVTLFMGIQSFLFYSLVAWLPTIIISKGMTEGFAGTMALTFQLLAIPATLLVPILCGKLNNQKALAVAICFVYALGMSLFLFAANGTMIIVAVCLISLAMGGSISLAIALISLRSPNGNRAAELSGMSQSAGYLLAAIGPVATGRIYDFTQNWYASIIMFIVLIFALAFCGMFAGRDIYVEE